jgi:hypothetical protein
VRACLPTKLPRMPEKSGFGTSSTAWVLNKSVVRTKFLPPVVELDKERVLALPILKDWPSSRTLPKPVLASFCPEKHNCEQQEPVYVMTNKREYTTIQGQGPWTPISKFQVFARKEKKMAMVLVEGFLKFAHITSTLTTVPVQTGRMLSDATHHGTLTCSAYFRLRGPGHPAVCVAFRTLEILVLYTIMQPVPATIPHAGASVADD